jgi:flagellar biosynthesis protein FlhF
MKAKRYIGPTSRAVLQQVRAELGPDAVILSNRSLPDGIEILAVSGEHMAQLVHAEETVVKKPERPASEGAAAIPFRTFLERSPGMAPPHTPPETEPLRAAAVAPADRPALAQDDVLAEIHSMKGLLREQMAALAWGETVRRRPLGALLLRQILSAGFSASLARAVTERLPDDFSESQARQWLHQVLARNLGCRPEPGLVAAGGVYALVGPTGVGKTTTTAKLAARAVMTHGAQGLGLITTDCYRVGAQDQLRIYGKILGVPVLVAQDATDLKHAVAALAGKHLVLIDTVGMSQRDKRIAEQRALLAVSGIRRLLLFNATAQKETLEDVVRAYVKPDVCGTVLTKLDEAVKLGGALDVLIRHRLKLDFVTSGQRVPEDLHSANPTVLVHRALKAAVEAGAALDPLELGAAIEESASAIAHA